jgi:hypothetical protein
MAVKNAVRRTDTLNPLVGADWRTTAPDSPCLLARRASEGQTAPLASASG